MPKSCPLDDPGHPGVLLREQVLPALGLTVSKAALDLATTRQNLHRILSGQSAISPEMAVRLERFCGVPAVFWLARQQACELSRAQRALADSLADTPRHALPATVLTYIGATDAR
ncbi:HigA family addiction module antitoxin [Roseomonas sp. WA12]